MMPAADFQITVSPVAPVSVEVYEEPDIPVLVALAPTVAVVEVRGPVSGTGDLSYVHDQGTPASVWEIAHGLGKHPVFAVIGSDGSVEEPAPEYINVNTLRLDFGAPVSGVAYLS